jgi:hypothetical protein
MMVVVRGTMKFLDGVKLAVSSLVEYYTGDIMLIPMVSLNLDIAPQHYRTLIGSGGGNIRKIMAETSTTLVHPPMPCQSRRGEGRGRGSEREKRGRGRGRREEGGGEKRVEGRGGKR